MNKVLIAVVNSQDRIQWREIVRSTWLPLVQGADVKFFVGKTGQKEADVVVLDCDDSYQGLPGKVQAITKYALENNYDFVLKLDDDVVINPVEMLSSGFDQWDYVGCEGHRPTPTRVYTVPGGFAYWMSRKCMEFVVNAPLPSDNNDERWVAGVLYANGIELHNDPRYFIAVCRTIIRLNSRTERLAPRKRKEPEFGTFAWCVFFENHGGTRYSTEQKINEFKRLFSVEVHAKQ